MSEAAPSPAAAAPARADPRATPLRYLVVAGACALSNNVVLIGGDRLGVAYAPASLVAFGVGVLLGYALHTRFTFAERPGWRGFVRYTLAMAINFPLYFGLLFVLVTLLRQPVALASPATTVLLFAWNYVASRWALVTRRPAAG